MQFFAISGLINGLVVLGVGIFVITHNWRNRINQLYFLLVVAITTWSLGYWQWLSAEDSTSALFWIRIFSIGSTLIPVFYFHWVVSLLGLNSREKNAIRLVYFATSLFLLFSFSDLFVKGVSQKSYFSFWPEPGILYHFYIFFTYVLIVGYSFVLLLKSYKEALKEKKVQIIYIFVGSAIAFSGGLTNFLLWYNIPVPPYGNFLVAVYPFLFAYAILKHHLFNVRVIATELLVFLIWIFLLIRTVLSETYQDLLINGGLLLAVIIVGILLIRSVLKQVRLREKLEILTKKVERAYQIEKKARKALQRLDESKSQFIMATQHHLRTPLTSMIGYVDLILTGVYGKVPEKLKQPILKFNISTKRLVRIVNELLDISQFEMGKKVVLLEPNIDVGLILDEAFQELKFTAKNKSVNLKLEKPKNLVKIKIDVEKFKVALFNLIDNAIKYTDKGGEVSIRAEVNSKLRIIIKDTGMGMDGEQIKNLFKRAFERGKEAKKVFATGRGIGLFISFKIIEAHDGRVWAESEGKGKGSSFFIELPIK
ncbi:MAG: ATP-binding protein [Candidatus Nealsonbacteria bacterium]